MSDNSDSIIIIYVIYLVYTNIYIKKKDVFYIFRIYNEII